jgi:chemotaxis regulatin CheY-phosphate phosphatase CheZ
MIREIIENIRDSEQKGYINAVLYKGKIKDNELKKEIEEFMKKTFKQYKLDDAIELIDDFFRKLYKKGKITKEQLENMLSAF